MKDFVAAVVQMNSGEDKERNLNTAERLVRQAARAGASFVALPETFNGCGRLEVLAQEAEPYPSPTLRRMAALARELRIYLLAGSILECAPVKGKAFNTSALISPTGRILAVYRKMHLFEADIAGHAGVREKAVLVPGTEVVSATTPIGVFGLSICFDLRFPELYRRLGALGAEILCVPSAFTKVTGKAHWEILLRARAIENQAFVVAPNQVGKHFSGIVTYGHSMIVDPWGTVLAHISRGEGIACAHLCAAALAEARKRVPALQSRRSDCFAF